MAIVDSRMVRFKGSKGCFGCFQVVSICPQEREKFRRISMPSRNARKRYNTPYEASIDLQNTDFGAQKVPINFRTPSINSYDGLGDLCLVTPCVTRSVGLQNEIRHFSVRPAILGAFSCTPSFCTFDFSARKNL